MKTRPSPPCRPARYFAMVLPAMVLAASHALANTELWIGTDAISNVSSNWSDNNNWSNLTGGGNPGPNGNDVIFGNTAAASAAGTVTSIVDQNNLNPNSMTFTNSSAAGFYQTVLIPAGITVFNTNNLVVGIRNNTAASYAISAAIAGPGTLTEVGTTLQVDNSTTTGGSGLLPLLDLSSLTNFVYTNSAGAVDVAGYSGSEARGSGQLNLAAVSNLVTVGTINVAIGSGNGGLGGTINLGTGTNIINVGTVNLGAGKVNTATIKFLGPTGGLRIRGVTGADSDRNVTMTLGNRSSSGTGTPTGNLTFTGGYPVDVKVSTITMARSVETGAGAGNLSFDTGTFDATTINMATNTSSGAATGTITVGASGTLIVSNLTLVAQGSTGAATGTLTINGGNVICSNSITKVTTAGSGNIVMTGGTLTIGNTVGTSAMPIDNVSLAGSTLTVNIGSTANAFVTSLTTSGGGDTINIASVPVLTGYPKQFPIIQYSSSINGGGFDFALGTLPAGSPAYQGYISNNVNADSVDLVLTNGPMPSGVDVWNGSVSSNWDLTTLNWDNSGAPTVFHPGDAVQFDDTAPGQTNINLTTTLMPGALVVSNSVLPYMFSGPGSLTGVVALEKYGTSSLLFANTNANTFSGGIVINAGTVQFGNNSTTGSFPPATTVTNDGNLVLDLANNTTIAAPIAGTGNLTQAGSGIVSLTASNSFSGQTTVSGNGSLLIDSYLGGGGPVSSGSGTTVGGNGTNLGPMNVAGNINPGDHNGIGTFTTADGLTLASGASASFDLTNSDATVGSGINDLLQINGNLNVNNNTIAVNIRGVPQAGMDYGVITYSGTLTGSFNPTIAGTHYAATVDTTSMANQVNVDITGSSGANLKWESTGSASWDNGLSQNWLNTGTLAADYFYAGDTVLFDDSVAGAVTNIVIPTGTTVYPASITNISSANSYTISGGSIGGSASLVKDGSSTLTISNANSYTGSVTIDNGTLKTGSGTALGTGAGGVTVNSGATLDVDGQNLGSVVVTASGAGANGGGAIVNSGPAQTSALKNVTLTGDTTFGGPNRWDIRGGSATLQTAGSPINITKVGTNQVSLVACTCNDNNLENVNIVQGIFAIQTTSTQYGDPNGFITVSNNAILDVYGLTAGLDKNIVLLDGGAIYSENGSTTFTGNLELTNNAANTAPGTGILTNASGTTLIVNSVIGGPGNLLKTGSGATQLGGVNTNAGATTINAGTLTLLGTGSLANSTPISVAAGATFDVTAFGPWSLTAGQTLSGSGVITGAVTSVTGSIIAPGSPTAVGVMTIAGNVSLGGTTTLKVTQSPTATNDVLLVNNSGTLTLGGTLTISVLGGSLAANDTFTLFNAAGGISGTFAVTNLPSPGPNLGWDTSNLAAGVLTVIATSTPTPHITHIGVSGTTLTLTATNGQDGGQFILLGTTNLTKPINQWTPVLTNVFDGSGNLNLSTNIINPAIPQEFYLLSE